MKMQEVITKMREIVPHAMSAASAANEKMDQAFALLTDLNSCSSAEARTLLSARLTDLMDSAKIAVARTFSHMTDLADLNDDYTRRLGPKKPKAEDPRQMRLDLGEAK